MAKELKTATLSLRVRPSVKARAEKRAAQDGRTLVNYIEWLIERDEADKPKRRT